MIRLLFLPVGYAFGCIQTSFILGKKQGVDIREHGSGNAGTTNALRVMGKKFAALVFIGDMGKLFVAVLLMLLLFKGRGEELRLMIKLYTGMGVVLGHIFPFYMNFKGGKGIAATAGMVIAFDPLFTVVGVITFFSIFFLTHYVSLGSILVYAILMIMLVICGQVGYFPNMEQGTLIEAYVVFALLLILAYWKHRENIKRLLSGTERKTYLSKKNKVD